VAALGRVVDAPDIGASTGAAAGQRGLAGTLRRARHLGASEVLKDDQGASALAISRDLGLSYKACFVLLHKLREAMAKGRLGSAPTDSEIAPPAPD
jgi:hypothetical protein